MKSTHITQSANYENMDLMNDTIDKLIQDDDICMLRVELTGEKDIQFLLMRDARTRYFYMYDCNEYLMETDNPHASLSDYGRTHNIKALTDTPHLIHLIAGKELPLKFIKDMRWVIQNTKLH